MSGCTTRVRASERRRTTFPSIVRDLGRLRAEHTVLDGVIVALDEHGRPSEAVLDAMIAEEYCGRDVTVDAHVARF